MTDQKNTILAIVLSALVLIGWQIYFGIPQMEKQKQIQQQQQQQQHATAARRTGAAARHRRSRPARRRRRCREPPAGAGLPGSARPDLTREAALAASPRVRIETPQRRRLDRAQGRPDRRPRAHASTARPSIPKSPPIVLLAPSGSPHPFYAEFGWVAAAGTTAKAPDRRHAVDGSRAQARSPSSSPVTLVYDNGEGLEFRRTIAVDDKYLFTVKDEVVNKGAAPVTLYPYALISRHGTPKLEGYYILHEGLIGVFGDKGLQEETYAKMRGEEVAELRRRQRAGSASPTSIGRRRSSPTPRPRFRRASPSSLTGTHQDLPDRLSARPADDRARRAPARPTSRLFAGAKEVAVIDSYDNELKLNRFELLIDWG